MKQMRSKHTVYLQPNKTRVIFLITEMKGRLVQSRMKKKRRAGVGHGSTALTNASLLANDLSHPINFNPDNNRSAFDHCSPATLFSGTKRKVGL
jgi:hypothetical protein